MAQKLEKRIKVFRSAAIPASLNVLLKGQLNYLQNYFTVTAIASEGPDLLEVKVRENVAVKSIEIQRKISLFKDFFSLVNLFIFFKKEKPHIVHSITPKAGLISMIAAKLAGVPIRMHTFTGLIFPSKTGIMQQLLIKMDKLLCWAATNIYPEGNGVKNDLINFNITSKPLKVLANGNVNGIDLEFFSKTTVSAIKQNQLKQDLGIRVNDFVFIFRGR